MFSIIISMLEELRNRKKLNQRSRHKLYVAMWYVFFLSTLVCLLHNMLTQKNNNNKPTISLSLSPFLNSISIHTVHVPTCTYVCMFVHMYMKASIILKIPQKQCLASSYFLFFYFSDFFSKKPSRKEMNKKKYLKKRLVKGETRRMFLLPGL